MAKELSILLVDDDVDDREIFVETVDEISKLIRCEQVSNGYECLQFLKSANALPNFIFLDLNMPKLNGKKCLAEIKKIEKLRKIPVIIYTTSTIQEDCEETRKLGAAHFLVKPSSSIELKEKLEIIFSTDWKEPSSIVTAPGC